MVSLDQLRVFKAVVEHHGVTHAAEQLHFTQPAVSSQLRRLEHALGVRLVERNGRSVTPTDAGAVVYEYSCQILASADAMQEHVAAMVDGGVEHIVVGANGATGETLPEVLVAFHRRHPAVQISVIEATSPELLERARRGTIDAGILLSKYPPQGVEACQLGEQELILVESARHPVSGGGSLTLQELAQLPFIRRPFGRAQLTVRLDNLFSEAGLVPPRPAMEIASWDGVRQALRAGVGFALTARTRVQKEIADGDLRIIEVQGYRDIQGVYLVAPVPRAGQHRARALNELLSCLKNELPEAL